MNYAFEIGAEVRVVRNVRNDGTYPGLPTGAHLVRRGATGHVRDVGLFLQDKVIYSVHFLDENRVVGCREEELQSADAPWVPSRFEFREKVTCKIPLGRGGEVVAEPGAVGQVIKVLRHEEGEVHYHVVFGQRTFQVPERVLEPAGEDGS